MSRLHAERGDYKVCVKHCADGMRLHQTPKLGPDGKPATQQCPCKDLLLLLLLLSGVPRNIDIEGQQSVMMGTSWSTQGPGSTQSGVDDAPKYLQY